MGDGVGETRAVEVRLESLGLGRFNQRGQVVDGVDRAEFRRIGQRERRRRLPVRLIGPVQRRGEAGQLDPPGRAIQWDDPHA